MAACTNGRPLRRLRSAAAIGVLLCALATQAQMQLPEAQLKAAFVFNFAKYIEWPAEDMSTPTPIIACVIGDADAIGNALRAFDGRAAGGRIFQVRPNEPPEAAGRCHIAVLSQGGEQHIAVTLKQLAAHSVLTVSDTARFVDGGGMIGIVRSGDRLQFDINQAALQRANLRASSQLLKLARNLGGRSR